MNVYLITDYPTILDPDGVFALGLVTAQTVILAEAAVLEALRVTGLDIGSTSTNLITAVQWDNTVPGVRLFIG